MISPPFPYYGGKYYMRDILIDLIPDHHIYSEVFGGAATLLLNKQPSKVEFYNDVDKHIVNFFKIVRHRLPELMKLLKWTPYAREEKRECWHMRDEDDELLRAWRYYVIMQQSFSGRYHSVWGYSLTKSRPRSFRNAIANLPHIATRLTHVGLENQPWQKAIEKHDTERTFIYLDPPYLPATRSDSSQKVYKMEMSHEDHAELIEILPTLKSKVLLSGYDNPLYNQLETEHGWRSETHEFTCSAAGRSRESGLQGVGNVTELKPRTEKLWYNYFRTQLDLF